MSHKLLKLQPDRDWETAVYINRIGLRKGKEITVKYVFIRSGKEFVELMQYTRTLLKNVEKSKVDAICRNAKGDIQKVYSDLEDIVNSQIDFEFTLGFSLDDVNIDQSDINDERSPIFSGIMDFCYENWIYDKVEDFAA
ncbi:hypothetical protein I6F48_00305 [Pseudoalteromonas sp. SWYJ118]|uniref:hypothetical protein n=1 Tax=Pseudoalteromonas sp. SWYJ118 TaxID=2792062 RepID=UPI0018CFE967|nr:hypothetical protein [Pseudoalteromonas sp. SWYJ118]MBH0074005.1 hypothetical protein [Pseudoalteromonas sp. SWYJ118]